MRHFWIERGLSPCKQYYPDPDGENRCTVCAKTFKRPQDLKAHRTRTRHYDNAQEKISEAAMRKAKEAKKADMQQQLQKVRWGNKEAANCWQFKYLGAMMQADGMQMPEIKSRVAMARQRHGKMRHVWRSNKLHPWLKMRLYVAGVCSVMVYGAETWLLTKEVTRLINGANSQMVAVITNNTPKEEATESTRTFDLIASIRAKRLKWLGLILRMDEGRMLKSAVKLMYDNRKEGDLLMDVPTASSWEGLCNMAKNEKEWGKKVKQIKDKVHRMKRKKRRRGGDSEDEKTKIGVVEEEKEGRRSKQERK